MITRGRDPRGAIRLGATLLVTALLVGVGPLSMTAAAEDRVVETALMMAGTPEPDGKPVKIDVTIMTTDPATPKPAIILAHGFGGTKADSAPTARTLARDGYAVIIYTARGFGASGGDIHLDNPAYEGADVTKLIDLAESRREIAKDGNDPVIGVAGGSYGGAISLIAAGLDHRVDAIVPAFTWNSLSQALFPQYHAHGAAISPADVTPVATQGVFKQRWASLLFLGAGGRSAPGNGGGATGVCSRFTAELCSTYLATAESGVASTTLIKLLDESSTARLLSKITAPTLIIQGEDDTLFPLDQADANLRGLPPSTPAAMKWVTGGHDGTIAISDYVGDLEAWFGRYLKKNGSAPDTSFSVVVPATSLVGDRVNREPRTLVTSSYPGRGAGFGQRRIQLTGDQQTVIAPPGGTPAALTNLPGTGGALGAASSLAGYSLGVLPGQAAIFTGKPLTDPLELVGSSRVDVEITSSATSASLFASLWDLGPDIQSKSPNGVTVTRPSSGVLPQLAVAPVRLTGLHPGRPTQLTIALPAVSHQVPVGHRLQLVVSTTDQAYALPVRTAVYQIGLTGDRAVALPALTAKVLGANILNVPLPLIIVVGLLALAAVMAMVLMRRRWRQADLRPDLAAVPLIVDDVVKTYRDGFRAVDGISFRAEAGQVVGLLGPNGAGKTTAMRMFVGLIRPDSGAIFVNGLPVHAGADVLGLVGAFIEGPGFLPHLTGVQNLRAYWEATGRPLTDAHLDEALAIAGLGTAINRRVRGYSHGMRQRLGIAQAMLGLPPLLVLDEPTNGLDPPQIKAMRAVLADYAAAGRTVVISSHLLSEVENTCSHVVVMDKGKVILTGAVADLVASDTVTLIGLADHDQVEAARRALVARGIQVEPEGQILRVVADLPRSEIVAGLVGDGYRVESVDGHRQLEEVFMSLVSAPAKQPEDADV
jgi:ABC-2 type transport system ATP-binding protein